MSGSAVSERPLGVGIPVGLLGGRVAVFLIFSPKRVFFVELRVVRKLDVKRKSSTENVQNLDQIRVDFEKL